jgi:hypothetical protein
LRSALYAHTLGQIIVLDRRVPATGTVEDDTKE